MAAAKRTGNYEEKIQVSVVTVDKEKSRVECATRDGAMIWAAVWETGTVFRWPQVGEKWTVRKDQNIWRLDGIVQTELAEVESSATPKTLEELPEGDTRIIGETVHMNEVSANGIFYDYGVVATLPTGASLNDICTYKAALGVYWHLVYTGEETYPWAKIGGPPLVFLAPGNPATTSATYVETNAPTGSAPLTGEYEVDFGAATVGTGGGTPGTTGRIAAFKGSAEISSIILGSGTGSASSSINFPVVPAALVKAETVHLKYRIETGTASTTFFGMYIRLDPKRVG